MDLTLFSRLLVVVSILAAAPSAALAQDPTPQPGSDTVVETGGAQSLLIYHQITALPEEIGFINSPVISADGSRVAFADRIDTDDPTIYGWYRIHAAAADGSGLAEVDDYEILCACNPQVDLSADGGTVVSTDGVQIRVAGAGGARELLVLADIGIGAARLTADGRTVIFVVVGDTTIRGGGQKLPRGVWAIDAAGGNLRQLVRVEELAAALGVPVEAAHFGNEPLWLDVSDDGSAIAFGTFAYDRIDDESSYVLAASGGGAPRPLLGPVPWLYRLAISGDGATVAYNAILPGGDPEHSEVGVVRGAGGTPMSLLSEYDASCCDDWLQLTPDDSRLLVAPDGLILHTETGAVWQLAVQPVGDHLLVRDELPRATMDADATRFLYVMNPLEQLATLDLAADAHGAAPLIAEPAVDPPELPLAGDATATASAEVSFAGTLVGVGVVALRDGREDGDLYGQLFDSGRGSDATANDGRFAGELLFARAGSEPGPRMLRIAAEVMTGDGMRHATAVEFGPLAVVP